MEQVVNMGFISIIPSHFSNSFSLCNKKYGVFL